MKQFFYGITIFANYRSNNKKVIKVVNGVHEKNLYNFTQNKSPWLNSPIKKQPVEHKSSVCVRGSLGQKKHLNTALESD